MARHADILIFAATLALVLLSVPSSYGQTAACSRKISECTSIGSSGIPDSNSAALTQFCSSVFPNLTECGNRVKSVCNYRILLSPLNYLLDTFGAVCGANGGQCKVSAAKCISRITSAPAGFISIYNDNFDPPVLQQICPVVQQVKMCFEEMDAQCKSSSETMEFIEFINRMTVLCANLIDGEPCPGIFSCFASIVGSNLNCSTFTTMLNCVKEKVQERSCNVDQASLSYSDLETMVSELCTAVAPFSNVKYGCGALIQCTWRGFGVTQFPLDAATLANFVAKVFTPKGMCKWVEVWSGCFDSEKSACGYNQTVVSVMTAQQTKFSKQCPQSDGDGNDVFLATGPIRYSTRNSDGTDDATLNGDGNGDNDDGDGNDVFLATGPIRYSTRNSDGTDDATLNGDGNGDNDGGSGKKDTRGNGGAGLIVPTMLLSLTVTVILQFV